MSHTPIGHLHVPRGGRGSSAVRGPGPWQRGPSTQDPPAARHVQQGKPFQQRPQNKPGPYCWRAGLGRNPRSR
eukprot:4371987-Pyramimonas_sp.AAC.1